MKKIIIIALSLFILLSCNTESKIEKEIVSDKNIEVKSEIVNTPELLEGSSKITISDLEKNISKLKDIDFNSEDLRMLNEQVIWMFNNSIENEAIKNNDAWICKKLDKNNIENCKKQVYIKSKKIDSCDNLVENYAKRDCKNSILKEQANSNLDETICDTLIFEEQEIVEAEEDLLIVGIKKYEINNCKNRVYEKKALKNIDSNICKKISEKNEIEMCEELVKMEKEMKKQEEEMKEKMKQEKERMKQQDEK